MVVWVLCKRPLLFWSLVGGTPHFSHVAFFSTSMFVTCTTSLSLKDGQVFTILRPSSTSRNESKAASLKANASISTGHMTLLICQIPIVVTL